MPSRRNAAVFDEIYSREKERVLDMLARAKAAQEGRPAFSKKPNEQLEAEAWDATDRAVTDEHYAQIAQQTVEELSQEKDEQGRPMWAFEQIETEVKLRQSLALHPYRAITYTTGVPDDDFEAQGKEAERVAARAQRRNPQPVADESGWGPPQEEDADPVASQGATQPAGATMQPQAQLPPAQQQSAEPMEGIAY